MDGLLEAQDGLLHLPEGGSFIGLVRLRLGGWLFFKRGVDNVARLVVGGVGAVDRWPGTVVRGLLGGAPHYRNRQDNREETAKHVLVL
jgi:hypothetical protein